MGILMVGPSVLWLQKFKINLKHVSIILVNCISVGAKSEWDFRISDLVTNLDGTDI